MWIYFIVPAVASIMGLIAMFGDYSHGNGGVDRGELNPSF
jgi:hypothetical protein